MVLPFAYIVTSIIHATAYFPIGEAIYYGFNPITTGSFFLQLALVGIVDILCRWWVQRRYRPLIRWPQIATILAGALAAYIMLVWNGGETWFYLYQEGYRLLFQ